MKKLVSLFICLAFAATAMAKPAYRGPITRTLEDGTEKVVYLHGDEHFHYMTDEAGEWLDETTLTPLSAEAKAAKVESGKKIAKILCARRAKEGVGDKPNPASHGIVILAEFQDAQFTKMPKDTADSMLNAVHFTRKYQYRTKENGVIKIVKVHSEGSVRKYFQDQSYGQYNPHFDVIGPVTLSQNTEYYGAPVKDSQGEVTNHDVRPREMVIEACEKAKAAGADFSQYDNNNDGLVDFVYVIYAGYGEADGGGENTIWPHQWDVSVKGKYIDGKKLGRYACGCELDYQIKVYDGIGTFCHEFSHVLGLPDFYITDYKSDHHTLSDWDVMDYGPYNNHGNTPAAYSAYERFYMGWLTPRLLDEPENVTLNPINKGNGSSLVITENNVLPTPSWQPIPNRFYLLETRELSGWDEYLPGAGMLITEVQYDYNKWRSNTVNNDASAMGVNILEATPNIGTFGNATDAYPAGATEWTALADHELTNISLDESTGAVRFLYRGGWAEGIEDIEAEGSVRKVLRDGKIVIIRNGVTYDLNGQTLDR